MSLGLTLSRDRKDLRQNRVHPGNDMVERIWEQLAARKSGAAG
jgi:hypothetical protein